MEPQRAQKSMKHQEKCSLGSTLDPLGSQTAPWVAPRDQKVQKIVDFELNKCQQL